jgi:hypothetical protein
LTDDAVWCDRRGDPSLPLIDVPALFAEPQLARYSAEASSDQGSFVGTLAEIAKLYATGAAYKTGIYTFALDHGLVRGWLDEFCRYWVEELAQSPMRRADFFSLLGRSIPAYNTLVVDDDASTDEHLRV